MPSFVDNYRYRAIEFQAVARAAFGHMENTTPKPRWTRNGETFQRPREDRLIACLSLGARFPLIQAHQTTTTTTSQALVLESSSV